MIASTKLRLWALTIQRCPAAVARHRRAISVAHCVSCLEIDGDFGDIRNTAQLRTSNHAHANVPLIRL
jgi:hypothetical protein